MGSAPGVRRRDSGSFRRVVGRRGKTPIIISFAAAAIILGIEKVGRPFFMVIAAGSTWPLFRALFNKTSLASGADDVFTINHICLL